MLEWLWWVPIAGLIATSGIAVYLSGRETGRKEKALEHGAEIAALKERANLSQWRIDVLEKALEIAKKAPDPKTEPEQPKQRDFYRWR